ncbi:MAG: transposase [Phycisphaerales bacterium]
MGATGRKQGRGDLSDAQWTLIERLLPTLKRGGKWHAHRRLCDGVRWVRRTGARWGELAVRAARRCEPSPHHRDDSKETYLSSRMIHT